MEERGSPLCAHVCYLQELGELQVAEVFGSVVAEVKADELTVPVEGDVVMHRRLAEYITHIFYRQKKNKSETAREIKMGRD